MQIVLATSPHLNHSALLTTAAVSGTPYLRSIAQTFVPMGLLSLAGATAESETVEIRDLNKAINSGVIQLREDFYASAARWLLESEPELIGFMTDSDSFHHIIQICSALKAVAPAVATLLGGVCATMNDKATLRQFDCVDFILRGEGEIAFPALVEALKGNRALANVGNLTYRSADEVLANPDLPLISDLDTLPFPDLKRMDLWPEDAVWIEIGRGCPFKCNFCVTAPYWKRKHRIKSPRRIISELAYFKKHGRTDFNFTHDLFTTDRRWVLRFCKALAEADLDVSWTCSSRTDTIDEEQIDWMRKAGCRDIYFGIESGTHAMQRAIDKDLNLDASFEIVETVLSAGINATLGFIVGLPGESAESLRGTLAQASQYLRDDRTTVHLFGYGPYRGSAHFDFVYPQLEFDPHYTDFPLPPEVRKQNQALMGSNFDIFARYSRLKRYDGLSSGIVRTAEEYFPLLNMIRNLHTDLVALGYDALELLIAWSEWLQAEEPTYGATGLKRYYGTLDEYLAFLLRHTKADGRLRDEFAARVMWERLQNYLRELQASGYRPEVVEAQGEREYRLNPSLKIEQFDAPGGDGRVGNGDLFGLFGFAITEGGTPQIARLNVGSRLVLDLAREGITDKGIADAVSLLNAMGAKIALSTMRARVADLCDVGFILRSPACRPKFRETAFAVLDGNANRIDDLRRSLLQHPIYSEVNSIARLKLFMDDHVFAVWDFMSLVKRLQQDLTCMSVPWFPVGDPRAARLINEIVIGEESDLGPDGTSPISHLDLYLRAMEEIGAEGACFRKFCTLARKGIPIAQCLIDVNAPPHVGSFVNKTIERASRCTTEEVLGAFLYGREDVIPAMFRSMRRAYWTANTRVPRHFDYYVLRHIELDGDSHGPKGEELLLRVIDRSEAKMTRAYASAVASIRERIELWNGTLEAIQLA